MSYFLGELVRAGACSQFKVETEMTGEGTTGNLRLRLKMYF